MKSNDSLQLAGKVDHDFQRVCCKTWGVGSDDVCLWGVCLWVRGGNCCETPPHRLAPGLPATGRQEPSHITNLVYRLMIDYIEGKKELFKQLTQKHVGLSVMNDLLCSVVCLFYTSAGVAGFFVQMTFSLLVEEVSQASGFCGYPGASGALIII